MVRPTPPSLESIEVRSLESRGLVEIKRTFTVISPMFGGGVYVDPDELKRQIKKPDPETPIRTASIRGQLRFWWRACSDKTSVSALKGAEDALWGTASRPGLVSLALTGEQPRTTEVEVFEMAQPRNGGLWNPRPRHGCADLAYGAFPLQPKGRQNNRLTPGVLTKLTGEMTLVVQAPSDRKVEVERAMDVWLAFGGLGGRTRRGFGAVAAKWPKDPETLLQEIQSVASALSGVPSLQGARLKTRRGDWNAAAVLENGLRTLRSFRQGEDVGRNNRPGQNHPGRSRWPEAEQIRDLVGPTPARHAEKLVDVEAFPRAAFGMPIIFHFPDNDEPDKTTLVPEGKERRASPLILRPYKSLDGTYRGLALVLADASRDLESVTLKAGGGTQGVRHVLTGPEAAWHNSPLDGQPNVLVAFLNFF